jgi:hypothetical protein
MKVLESILWIASIAVAITLCFLWDVIQSLRGNGIVDRIKKENALRKPY